MASKKRNGKVQLQETVANLRMIVEPLLCFLCVQVHCVVIPVFWPRSDHALGPTQAPGQLSSKRVTGGIRIHSQANLQPQATQHGCIHNFQRHFAPKITRTDCIKNPSFTDVARLRTRTNPWAPLHPKDGEGVPSRWPAYTREITHASRMDPF